MPAEQLHALELLWRSFRFGVALRDARVAYDIFARDGLGVHVSRSDQGNPMKGDGDAQRGRVFRIAA